MRSMPFSTLTPVYALLLAATMLAITIPAAATKSEEQEAPPLAVIQPIIEVDDDYIRLGDLFDPVVRHADRVVARSPDPGSEITLPATWLWKAAKTFGVDWKPSSAAETVTVVRPSSTVGADALESLLIDAYFRRTGEDDLVELETDGGTRSIHLPRTAAPTARVDRFDYDPRTGRFTATMVAPADGRPLERVNVAGRFHRLVELPVPVQRLGSGHIIEEGDITLTRLREDGLGTNLIVDPERLIGQAVHRSLSAGKPVRLGDVRAPVLVHKGRIVTVKLETEAMLLTVQGRAKEDGALNDVIRVQNTQSNTIIDAVVTGEGRVQVELPEPLAMQTN